jgi:hypothetical protein
MPPPTTTIVPSSLPMTDGLAERADKIQDRIPRILRRQLQRRGADGLEYQQDFSLFPVEIRDRQRDPLALFIHPQHDELPRLRLLRHTRCADGHRIDVRRKLFFLQNLKHTPLSCSYKD